jgi:hypothetical protein
LRLSRFKAGCAASVLKTYNAVLETYGDQPIVKKAWEEWYNHFGPRTDSAQDFLEQLKLYKKAYKVKAISEI